MSAVKFTPLTKSIQIQLIEKSLPISDAVQNIIEALWQKELQKRSGLFNGKILAFDRKEDNTFFGYFIEYKQYLALRLQPDLIPELKLKTFAVSGVVRADDAILFGKRAATVTHYPDFYELVPSGGIDDQARDGDGIDYQRQLLLELQEETGIEQSDVEAIRFLGIIEDEGEKLIELCAEMKVHNQSCLKISSNQEYDQLEWIVVSQISDYWKTHQKRTVPASLAILKNCI